MKTFRSSKGPFAERPYYKNEEIERICEDELRAAGLYPTNPEPIRIDRFIEKRFKVTPHYEELGEGILGFTIFGPKGVQAVIVAQALDEEGTQPAERRIRTTLAHEAGHGLLHAHLFCLDGKNRPLFGDLTDPGRPKVLCRDVPVTPSFKKPGYDGRWWEFQANRAIGPLLLPRSLALAAIEPFLVPTGLLGGNRLEPGKRGEAARNLAEVFDVNPVVARIRLQDLYPEQEERQLRL